MRTLIIALLLSLSTPALAEGTNAQLRLFNSAVLDATAVEMGGCDAESDEPFNYAFVACVLGGLSRRVSDSERFTIADETALGVWKICTNSWLRAVVSMGEHGQEMGPAESRGYWDQCLKTQFRLYSVDLRPVFPNWPDLQ